MTEKNHSVVPLAGQVPVRSIMHPMVERMLTNNPTPEALEKLLAMQREWEAGEAKRAFTAALVELKSALPAFLTKDKTVDFTGNSGKRTTYSHTSLAAAMETVTPILSEYGFSLTWKPGTNAQGGVTVTAILMHRQGHSAEATLTAPVDTSGNKSAAQGLASTITLLQRYSALALLGLSSRDMTEPAGEAEPTEAGRVDTARNMRALASIVKGGKSKDAVEKYVGKPVGAWTAQDLDRLRAWVDHPPAAPAVVPDELISKEDLAGLAAIEKKYKLTPAQFGEIVAQEIGRKPKGRADLRKTEVATIVKLFSSVEAGELDIRDGKIERPPAEPGADVGEENVAAKYDPEKPDDCPF